MTAADTAGQTVGRAVILKFGELQCLPVYQWRKAFLLNMAVNCSETRLNISWMAVELPAKMTLVNLSS